MKKELNEVYSLLSALPVNGDVVDVIAAIRPKLRKLIKEADDGE